MAKRIEGPYDFSEHEFMKYADGATWELTEGEDFDEKTSTVRTRARKWAKGEGLKLEDRMIEGTAKTPERLALRFTRVVTQLRRETS